MIEIYTDGGCRNLSIGAWAFAVVENGAVSHSAYCSSSKTTNNEMELTAIRQALLYLKMLGISEATIYSDSQYSVNAINIWYDNWVKTCSLSTKKNVPLLTDIKQIKPASVNIVWVKGHADNPYNILADRLVNEAMDSYLNSATKLPPSE